MSTIVIAKKPRLSLLGYCFAGFVILCISALWPVWAFISGVFINYQKEPLQKCGLILASVASIVYALAGLTQLSHSYAVVFLLMLPYMGGVVLLALVLYALFDEVANLDNHYK